MTITVSGSFSADEAPVCNRVQRFLSPYLSDATSWLVGAVGTVDLASIRFLLDHCQQVTAVGYNRFDCAPQVRVWIDEGRLRFVDASVEAIPRRMMGSTERDIYKDEGTKEMVQYFRDQGISTLLAFI